MQVDRKYAFLLLISSVDGRFATKTVTVTPATAASPEVSVISLINQFNAGSKVILEGYLSSSSSATAVWNVYTTLGELVPFEALTPTTQIFTAAESSSQLSIPLSVAAGSFVGGRSYTFRLTTFSTADTAKSTFSELVITANGPPTGGYAAASPNSGDALVTKFFLSCPGWTTDSANFPLSYSYAYTTSDVTPFLTLSTHSPKAYSFTTLPAGLTTLKNVVTVQGGVMDIFSASVTAVTSTTVYWNPSANISQITKSSLQSAFLASDINLVYQTVNNVSTSTFSVHYSYTHACSFTCHYTYTHSFSCSCSSAHTCFYSSSCSCFYTRICFYTHSSSCSCSSPCEP